MKAFLKNYRQSPRKVRLLADLVRGKDVRKALSVLSFANKRAAGPFAQVLNSAVAKGFCYDTHRPSVYTACRHHPRLAIAMVFSRTEEVPRISSHRPAHPRIH